MSFLTKKKTEVHRSMELAQILLYFLSAYYSREKQSTSIIDSFHNHNFNVSARVLCAFLYSNLLGRILLYSFTNVCLGCTACTNIYFLLDSSALGSLERNKHHQHASAQLFTVFPMLHRLMLESSATHISASSLMSYVF